MNTVWSFSAVIAYKNGSWASSEVRRDNSGYFESGPNIRTFPSIINLLTQMGLSAPEPEAHDDVASFTFRFSAIDVTTGSIAVIGDTELVDVITNNLSAFSASLANDSYFTEYFIGAESQRMLFGITDDNDDAGLIMSSLYSVEMNDVTLLKKIYGDFLMETDGTFAIGSDPNIAYHAARRYSVPYEDSTVIFERINLTTFERTLIPTTGWPESEGLDFPKSMTYAGDGVFILATAYFISKITTNGVVTILNSLNDIRGLAYKDGVLYGIRDQRLIRIDDETGQRIADPVFLSFAIENSDFGTEEFTVDDIDPSIGYQLSFYLQSYGVSIDVTLYSFNPATMQTAINNEFNSVIEVNDAITVQGTVRGFKISCDPDVDIISGFSISQSLRTPLSVYDSANTSLTVIAVGD